AARFFLEFVRINPPWLFGLSQAQLISIFLVSAGAFLLVKKEDGHVKMTTSTPSLPRRKGR
ncbi:MAG: hypothetical protein AB7P69_15615, partial [Candidatus Binatia bacterium]